MADAIQNTLEKLDMVYLPREAEKPLLLHYDPSLDPVMELSLSTAAREQAGGLNGNAPTEGRNSYAEARRLRRLAELQVKRALEPIPGVAAARVRGGLEEEIHVLIDAAELQRVNLSIDQVINRLRAENLNSAGGRIREGAAEYMIRTINEYKNLEEIANTVVFRRDGREIRLKDLGEVVYGQRDREMLTRTDGGESVQIDIYKEADSNMVKVGERIRAAVGSIYSSRHTTLAGRLFQEEGVVLQVVADRSVFIDNSIREVKHTAVMGGGLAIFVLLLFLRDLRTTSIVAVSIPISIFATFAPLDLLGVSLNIMSLGGLAMGVGMLVDSSIVVLESVYRCREEGDSIREAAIRGTREVRGAVIASTLTSVCVFFPMVFVEGLAGQVFSDLGLTVVTSLIASLIVAVLFIPMLASRTGFQLRAGAGMVAHPLGGMTGRLRPSTFVVRVLVPLALLLGVMIGTAFLYSSWTTSRVGNPNPGPPADDGAMVLKIIRLWGLICLIPITVALLKIRLRPQDPRGERLAELWVAFAAFRRSRQGDGKRRWLMLPYFVVRLPISLLLELVGLSLTWIIRMAGGAFFLLVKVPGWLRRFLPKKRNPRGPEPASRFYPVLLRWALSHPTWIVMLAGACVALTYTVGKRLQSELLPEVHQSEFTFEAALPVGTPLDETVFALSQVEQAILDRKPELQIET